MNPYLLGIFIWLGLSTIASVWCILTMPRLNHNPPAPGDSPVPPGASGSSPPPLVPGQPTPGGIRPPSPPGVGTTLRAGGAWRPVPVLFMDPDCGCALFRDPRTGDVRQEPCTQHEFNVDDWEAMLP